ncbi:hypothetical protein Q5752_006822 [Cryptotrichosporon argae]
MEGENDTKPGQSSTGQRRSRPQPYTSHACERCRSRKQRCFMDGDDTTRNCLDSGSVCVISTRPEKSKRVRSDPPTTQRAEDATPRPSPRPSVCTTGQIPIAPRPDAIPVLPLAPDPNPNMYTTYFDPTRNGGPIAGPSGDVGASTGAGAAAVLAGAATAADFDWDAWANALASHGRGSDNWQTLLTNIAAQRSSVSPRPAISPAPAAAAVPLTAPAPPALLATAVPSSAHVFEPSTEISPGVVSDEGSMFEAAKGLAMISLEAAAEPHYVGESSGSIWTTVIAHGMQTTHAALESLLKTSPTAQVAGPPAQPLPLLKQALLRPIPEHVAATLLETVYQHLHSRYPFMDWVTFDIQWKVRNAVLAAVGQDRRLDREGSVAAFFILMILAVGTQICRDMNLPGLLKPEEYYALAQPFLNVMVQLHNLANIQAFLLVAMYSLRDSRGPSVWYLSGLTIRLCIGLGLHRNVAGRAMRTLGKYEIEMRKRVFWAAYTLDRMMALLLGRPPGISDDDIDVDLPELFVPEANLSIAGMRTASMASSIHYIRLKRIESRIQRAVYTVARDAPQTDPWALLRELDDWEAEIPAEASANACWSLPCCSRDWFHLRGVEARLQLLRPLCTNDQATKTTLLPQLALNAARGCELQKRTHQLGQPGSSTSVRSTFICGLALLYAVFLRPSVLPLKDVFSAIKAASNTLFAYSHKDRTSEVLYDVFEELSSVCVEQLSQGAANPTPEVSDPSAAVEEWQRASADATNNIPAETAGQYVDFLRSLGLSVGEERTSFTPAADSLWDLAAFSPGNFFGMGPGQDGVGNGNLML